MKRCCGEPVMPTLPPDLPLALVTLARAPIPDSPLFHKALCSVDALDESELHHWDGDPPYLQPVPADTIEEKRFTRNLIDVMFGHRLHLENKVKGRRVCRYQAGEVGDVMMELCATATQTLAEWTKLYSLIGECKGRRHKEMAQSLLQWRALVVYSYNDELKQLGRGESPY
ncbi:hypothetical protein PAXINDRAFT_87851 [Paxillus involutus ATCC 200175]|uniref:Uncharacterized protein n=1 Tax=Paxillus involutus ATCC 200175 TaxID=664439 RepID=A0A0C9TN15_PAXIN|nr:hypothetical protein PAXINDRAFT_87851 [Paxillus involutus ATCC 200175]